MVYSNNINNKMKEALQNTVLHSKDVNNETKYGFLMCLCFKWARFRYGSDFGNNETNNNIFMEIIS